MLLLKSYEHQYQVGEGMINRRAQKAMIGLAVLTLVITVLVIVSGKILLRSQYFSNIVSKKITTELKGKLNLEVEFQNFDISPAGRRRQCKPGSAPAP